MELFIRNKNRIMARGNMADALAFQYQLSNRLTMSQTLTLLYPEIKFVSNIKKMTAQTQSDKHIFDLLLSISYKRDGTTIEWKYRVINAKDLDFLGVKINNKKVFNSKMKIAEVEINMAAANKYLYDIPIHYFVLCEGAKLQQLKNKHKNQLLSYEDIYRVFGSCSIVEKQQGEIKIGNPAARYTNFFEHPALDIDYKELPELMGITEKNVTDISMSFENMIRASNEDFKRKVTGLC